MMVVKRPHYPGKTRMMWAEPARHGFAMILTELRAIAKSDSSSPPKAVRRHGFAMMIIFFIIKYFFFQ
jgi:hypothetical protein